MFLSPDVEQQLLLVSAPQTQLPKWLQLLNLKVVEFCTIASLCPEEWMLQTLLDEFIVSAKSYNCLRDLGLLVVEKLRPDRIWREIGLS